MIPYAPQQNGVVERMNWSLMERARSMLGGVHLEQKFWVEEMPTKYYFLNHSPMTVLIDKMPLKEWSNKKPSLRH